MRKWLIIGSILLAAASLRLVGLARRPGGFTWDEAALGYNAYSLLLTGRDEYGTILPVVLKSFGDYKPGLYAYFTTPAVAILGLNELATRLPAAMVGILLVAAAGVLAARMLGYRYGIFTMAVLAINPWAIQFSRGAWEANLALLLTVVGAITLLRQKYLLTALFWGLTFWSYQGAKLFTPALALVFLLTLKSSRWSWRQSWLPVVCLVLLGLPILVGLKNQSGRLKVYSLFSYSRQLTGVAEILRQDGTGGKTWQYYLWHFEAYDQLRGIVQRYTNYFSPAFLFFAGNSTNGREATPYVGYFLLPEAVTLLAGIYILVKSQLKYAKVVWWWLLLAPVPAALSRDLISGVRSLPLIVPLSILVGIGWSKLMSSRWIAPIYCVVLVFFSIYFGDMYFVHAPYYTSSDLVAAYRPAWQIVKNNLNSYDQVIFTTQLGQPYIFGLFYLQYNPRLYQAQAKLAQNPNGDVGEVTAFNNFHFRPIYWPEDRKLVNTLFVGGQYELPEKDINSMPDLIRLGDVNYANGMTALRIAGTK